MCLCYNDLSQELRRIKVNSIFSPQLNLQLKSSEKFGTKIAGFTTPTPYQNVFIIIFSVKAVA